MDGPRSRCATIISTTFGNIDLVDNQLFQCFNFFHCFSVVDLSSYASLNIAIKIRWLEPEDRKIIHCPFGWAFQKL